ncbi:MAG: sigma-54 dependent transcriptional regulator [Rikenellaceae bacterium]|nr:sigma-54 dependent transcriptional regulator [Rikenellaceae bacterium]
MNQRILIVDDEVRIRKIMTLLFREEGYRVLAVENGREALRVIGEFDPDVVLLDQQMPGMSGTQVLEKIKQIRPEQTVLFVSAFGSVSLAGAAIRKGAFYFIEKPFDNDNLIFKVKRALEMNSLKGEVKTLRRLLDKENNPIVGESGALKEVVAQIGMVAQTHATVLVHGESGTEKELIARAVHTHSLRSAGPFVAVNCGAIPLSLMESELFGYEKGAFTDARDSRAGTFEAASRGTLFLDEVGELPMDAQVKILRVLEEKKVTRLGSKKTIPIDVRIIAATNRNLEEEVRKGNFRLDLFYRLNVFTVTLPPLRERHEDIPLLVDYFIDKHNRMMNLQITGITREAMALIKNYDWPGNVRDLDNALQSAMILASQGILKTEHLPLRVRGYEQAAELPDGEELDGNIRDINARFEKEIILEMLKKHNYNRTLTAQAMKISRKTLFNKMKRYGLLND